MSQLVQTAPPVPRLRPAGIALWQSAVLGVLALWLYGPTLYHLVLNWRSDLDYSHGFFVPLFSAYVVWQKRHRLAQLPLQPSSAGLVLLALSLLVLSIGQLGAELFLARFSLILLTTSLIVLFLGWNYFRALLFPLAFLVLMIPLPALIFDRITFPLQLLASRLGGYILSDWCQVPVFRDGNILQLTAKNLEVEKACSGIRSLLSLTTLAIIYGYLMEPRILVRVLLALSALPIAIVANGLRIVVAGLLVQYWGPDTADGFLHFSSGLLIFVICLLVLYALHQLLRRIWPAPKEFRA